MSDQQTKPEVKIEEWDDELLDEGQGPAAIVVREHLRPAAGSDAPIAPPTFAGRGQGNSSYHCDGNASEWAVVQDAVKNKRIVNRCTIDSIPSQANRLESALRRYEGTRIPKVTLEGVKNESMSLLDVGHRVADAAVLFADGYEDFGDAIEEYVKGNSGPLGKLAPTSLLFGYWDSRGEGAKARRLIRSEIVATNVVELTRRSQYWASVDPESNEELKKALDEAKAKAKDDQEKDVGSQLGFRDAPASGRGGVIVYGDITRTTILSLTGLRNLAARRDGKEDEAQTLGLRRYLLGLMLAVASSPRGGWDLREGCLLVQERREGEGGKEVPWVECRCVYHDGHESPWQLPGRNHVDEYVELAARAFLAPEFPPKARTLTFNTRTATQRVREKLAGKGEKKGSRQARPKG